MKRIFLFPTEEEAARFRKAAPEARIVISGVGPAETAVATAKALNEGCKHLILAGIAGTYDPSLEAGAVVAVSEERIAGLPEAYAKSYGGATVPKGLKAVKGNTVAQCGAAAEGAQIENMEGAVFFALCSAAGVRFSEIRSVSNLVGAPRSEWNVGTALDNLTLILTDTFIKKRFMNKSKFIIYTAMAVILIAAIALIVSKWKLWFTEIMTWVLVIAVSFFAGWLIGRFGGRKKKKEIAQNGKQ